MVATSAAAAVAAAAAAVYVAANAIASVIGITGASAICVDGAADDVAARSTIAALVSDDANVVVPA